MKISKKDARMWMAFFASLPEDEPLLPRQQEIALAAVSQIEAAADAARRSAAPRDPGAEVARGAHVLRRSRRQVPAGLPLVPAGHGVERRPQDQPLQRALPLLLRLWRARPHRAHRRGLLGDRRRALPRGGHRPAAVHLRRADRHLLRLPRAVHGNRACTTAVRRALPRRRHPPAHVHQRHTRHRGKPARAWARRVWTSCASIWARRTAPTA